MILDELLEGTKPGAKIFLASIVYTIIGMYVGYVLFHKPIPMVFFSAMPLSHYIYNIFRSKTSVTKNELITLYVYAFLGMALVFGIGHKYFFKDFDIIGAMTGRAYNPYGMFSVILMNNLKVMFVCFAMSLIYGTGATFILALNAAMAGQMFSYLTSKGLKIAIMFLPHTITEILAYFFGAIAGGLVAVAIIGAPKNLFSSNRFGNQMLEAASFYTIGVGILIVAAFLESFVLPAMMGTIPLPW